MKRKICYKHAAPTAKTERVTEGRPDFTQMPALAGTLPCESLWLLLTPMPALAGTLRKPLAVTLLLLFMSLPLCLLCEVRLLFSH